ncbi:hypothetical protein G7B40_014335 [Aetokthonos hydrillicola Thurmond2011]|uniref:Uncharacterized protein n=1 Tax=Aetokthonos hydrillicola Thurmond2011 TaxID=2712845 RepID=A0AAP5I6P6_9CYAN|nr:hypothetical protein [Aetokthonos hydrillicola]MBW4589938.1 hypothetical protein [Aetokthonos hydrillicola CCALA 1050]MDR9895735.1 hypothetical protein [Aetokthonos hydrillicola Thurmond2011]
MKKHGFILAISLSGAEQKPSKKGVDVYTVNNGYCSKAWEKTEKEATIPLLVSWNGFGIHPNGESKITLTHYDRASHIIPKVDGVPINWNLNLDNNFLKNLLRSNKKENNIWKEFCEYITKNQKLQLQLLIGKLQDTSRLSRLNFAYYIKHTVLNIQLSNEDILSASLVTPGPEFLAKVDRPAAVTGHLKGREVEEGDAVKVVPWNDVLIKQLQNTTMKTIKQELNSNNLGNNYLHMVEIYRRLYLCRFMYASYFPPHMRKEANTHYNSLATIANKRDIPISDLIGEILDSGSCPENSFLEEHIEYLQQLAYYLLYGNPEEEVKVTSAEQRQKARAKATEIVGKLINDNLKQSYTE